MPRIIDGDNLLGTWPRRSRDRTERRKLAGQVSRWSARERRRAVLVFDGPEPDEPLPHHDVRFSAARTADDLILLFLREQADPRAWVVVTSDRSLGDRCRHLGATIERCDRFRERLAERRGEKPEGPVDVEDWRRYFDGVE